MGRRAGCNRRNRINIIQSYSMTKLITQMDGITLILDATAGNRTMWKTKQIDSIIYLDMERKLMNKPTIFADNTQLPFLDGSFHTIFYDPPHSFGGSGEPCPIYPSEIKKYKQEHEPFAFTYYGWDKYNTQYALVVHLIKAFKEFHRVLADDGLLWFKWNEIKMSLRYVLTTAIDWQVLLRLPVNAPSHTASDKQTYWVCFAKIKREYKQTTL